MLGWWTLRRAIGTGATAGVVAFLLWPLYVSFGEPVFWPFLVALVIAAFCGVSIVWITAFDLITHRRRGDQVRPIRIFDLLLALVLLVPSAIEIDVLLRP